MSTPPTTPPGGARPTPPGASRPLLDADLRALMERAPLPHARVLSLYLDAEPDAQGKCHGRLFLERRARSARSRLARLPVDLRGYDALIERIRESLTGAGMGGAEGIAVFAELPPADGAPGGGGPLFQAFRLPVRVEDRFVLARSPDLGPVLRAVGRHAHYLAVRLDADDARILSVYLARAVGEASARPERRGQQVPGRIRAEPGGWSQMRFQRRKGEHVQRWYRDLAGRLERVVDRERPDGVVLLGQDPSLVAFRHELPEPVARKVVGTDAVEPHRGDAEIVAQVEPLLEGRRDVERGRLVDELHDRVLRDWYAVGGLDDTLEALQEGKVERLVLARDFDGKGVRCESCGFLLAAVHARCPYCGGQVADVPVLQHLVRKAEEQEARVDFVEEPDPRLREDLEGVGALLRF